jgi:glycosyltransferase involved in cell wall biosynthesis
LPNAEDHFVSQGMTPDKFTYLPNGIDIENKKKMQLSDAIVKQIPKDKFIIAYTGTVGIANNLDYMIKVAVELKAYQDIHFMILGHGGEKQRLQEKVKALGLDNVTFLEPVKKEMVKSFLDKIDVAFISLLREKLFRFGVSPNKVFDYMYAKKPIIWAIEAGNNLVEEAQCGTSVPLDDVQGLKKSILALKSMPKDKLKELGQNGYNFVEANHNYEKLANKLMMIIEE